MTTTTPSESPVHEMRRGRIVAFAIVCLIAVVVSVVAVVLARRQREQALARAEPVAVVELGVAASMNDDVDDLMFESTALGDTYGFLATVPADGSSKSRAIADLRCERVHFQAGRGVCLQADRGFVTTYDAVVFDADLDVAHTIGLAGPPSRVRVSPSGTLAGATVFVTGHSYAEAGFSTQTTLLDLSTGAVVADLETDFSVFRDDERWREIDFNFWGVTFVDDARFYATLGTGADYFLVEGDVGTRRFDIVTDSVECPSLSPDGTRVAYKARVDDGLGPVTWRMEILDMMTMERTRLAEVRSVDDQVAWLDNDTVMYGIPAEDSPAETDTWVVPADGTGTPELLVEGAWSAAMVAAG